MFTIQTSGNSVIEHQMKKQISNIDARKTLLTNIKIAEHKLNDKDRITSKYIDKNDARKELEKNKRDYDRTSPETLSSESQNAMWKRAKELKDEFMVGMLSHDELHPMKGIQVDGSMKYIVDWEKISTNRTVERNNAWYKKNDSKLSEFKNIMRHLAPDNPTASDVEKFRPHRKTV